MHEPILKLHWERFSSHVVINHETAQKLLSPFTDDAIAAVQLLSEGCANTNYKISFRQGRNPIVLRIYVREKSALQRETALHNLVSKDIPVPGFLYSDSSCHIFEHPYAVIEWIDGMLLRELILKKDEQSITECVFEAGLYLAALKSVRFPEGGFFEGDLTVRPFKAEEHYRPFVHAMLEDEIVKISLGTKLHGWVSRFIDDNVEFMPNENNANLTHGDYDPANMIVRKIEDHWHIAAILDWEFSFAGSYFLDMGMMLRYSHKLPSYYEKSFINGFESAGEKLPLTWKKRAKLMDLLCLLQLAHYNPSDQRPNLNRDVVDLIKYTVEHWRNW